MRLLSCLFLSLAIATVAVGQAIWDGDIQAKAKEFNLGGPLPETPRPVQTSSLHGNGWWQAFERGRVYWMSSTGARVVWGDIGDRWAALNREQGELEFPLTDELPVEGADPRDRVQRFVGGSIYWRAATRETTVKRNQPTQTVQAAPNYATTAPATVEAVPNTATVAPLQYTVPGQAGRKWIDTGLDLRAGVLVYLSADGKVDYGSDIGTLGPAGAPISGVSGLPAETTNRYGLVARVTSSRTSPEDDLREDHAYGESKEFCARTAGHLWLTVNDKEPNDNRGEYTVIVELGTCATQPVQQPTPDPGRGRFRVTIVGFRVDHVVHDGLLDAGDDAYLMWDADEFNADGRLVGNHSLGQTLVYGDTGRNRAQVQAGTQGDNGGLKNGDEIKGRAGVSSNRLPVIVGDFDLVDRANAIVFSPTIWIANNETGDYPSKYRQRVQSRVRFAAYDVRHFLETNFAQFHWGYSLSRGPDDWFEMLFSGRRAARQDRPVGLSFSVQLGFQNLDDSWSTLVMDFVPDTFLLTYKTVTDLLRSSGGGTDRREVRFDAQYRRTVRFTSWQERGYMRIW